MRFHLFQEVVLAVDVPEKGLRTGDIATIVETHPVTNGENGYTLELFNAIGDTIAVITLPQSALAAMTADEVLRVRQISVIS